MRGNGLNYGDTWIEQHYVQRQREVKKTKVAYFKPIINDFDPRNVHVKSHCKLENNFIFNNF
jgi:hypothetical protein